ncbi:MAG: carboxypeptidase regulatory-like domain-containing protein [Candidatus Edwardsbacteria bacterium]|nr:carboxypeptidase regulatory-like domain-containing protein [Candidatus Edwardsbacteria bacterium]
MKKYLLIAISLFLALPAAQAARFPLLGGPGLIHLQSAKAGQGFGFRSFNAITNYGSQKVSFLPGDDNSYNDLWSYNLVNYSPMDNLAFMVVGLAHAEQWSIKSPGGDSLDNTLGCPGDFTIAAKYGLQLYDGMVDLAFMPMVTIPMDKEKFQDSPSQTGQVDFGGKLLTDLARDKMSLLVNVGFLTRGDQRPQVPAGLGVNYEINHRFSAFMETSAELRIGSKKDSLPDSLILSGRGFDRTEARLTPGLRFVPLPILGVNLAADIGLTRATPSWQLILGLDFPAAAGLIRSVILPGTVAGLIKHRQTNQPIRGMISFPGTDMPAVVSQPNGSYQLKLNPGTYNIKVMANGFRTVDRKLEVKSGESQSWDLTLSPREGTIKGQVADAATGRPVSAVITLNGNGDRYHNDQATGGFSLTLAAPKKYDLSVAADGYQPFQASISLTDKEESIQNIVLQPIPKPQPVQPAVVQKPAKPPVAVAAKPKPERKPAPKAPGLNPEEVADLYKTGVKQYMSEEYDQAVATFKKLLAADPGNTKARDYLKKSQERLKKIRG